MKGNSQRGDIALFVEVIVVVIIILAFLVALKIQSGSNKVAVDKDLPQSVYPTTISTAEKKTVGTATPVQRVTAPPYIPEAIPERTEPYEIIYTDVGFSPDITRMTGSNRVVVFRNRSSRALRIVADRNVSDANFPDLSAPIDTPQGGTYWFAFPAGAHTYSFHAKSSTNHRGTIIVR